MKGFQTVFTGGGKRLKEQYIVYSQLIPWILKCHDVMSIAKNTFGFFPHRKHVLAQVNNRDILMMGMFGE